LLGRARLRFAPGSPANHPSAPSDMKITYWKSLAARSWHAFRRRRRAARRRRPSVLRQILSRDGSASRGISFAFGSRPVPGHSEGWRRSTSCMVGCRAASPHDDSSHLPASRVHPPRPAPKHAPSARSAETLSRNPSGRGRSVNRLSAAKRSSEKTGRMSPRPPAHVPHRLAASRQGVSRLPRRARAGAGPPRRRESRPRSARLDLHRDPDRAPRRQRRREGGRNADRVDPSAPSLASSSPSYSRMSRVVKRAVPATYSGARIMASTIRAARVLPRRLGREPPVAQPRERERKVVERHLEDRDRAAVHRRPIRSFGTPVIRETTRRSSAAAVVPLPVRGGSDPSSGRPGACRVLARAVVVERFGFSWRRQARAVVSSIGACAPQ